MRTLGPYLETHREKIPTKFPLALLQHSSCGTQDHTTGITTLPLHVLIVYLKKAMAQPDSIPPVSEKYILNNCCRDLVDVLP